MTTATNVLALMGNYIFEVWCFVLFDISVAEECVALDGTEGTLTLSADEYINDAFGCWSISSEPGKVDYKQSSDNQYV